MYHVQRKQHKYLLTNEPQDKIPLIQLIHSRPIKGRYQLIYHTNQDAPLYNRIDATVEFFRDNFSNCVYALLDISISARYLSMIPA